MSYQNWIPGNPPADYTIGNARAVLPDRVVDNAAIIIRGHRVADVTPSAGKGFGWDIDAGGLYVTPGFIDTHTDALEKERVPRASAEMPAEFALLSLEGRLRGAGITTVYHGTGFRTQRKDGVERTPRRALEESCVIDNAAPGFVDHRVLHRLEIYSPEGTAVLRERLDTMPPADHPLLISFEDHSPGQGQFPSREGLINHLIHDNRMTPEAAEQRADESTAAAENNGPLRADTEQWLSARASAGRVRLLAHDADSAESIDRFVELGGAVAEFPTTLPAARRAREVGLVIAGGGPNALRGRSHSGNVSVAQLAAEGLVDSLTSDYFPAAMLGGAKALIDQGLVDLPQGISLITAGPARVAGAEDRGELVQGKLADFAFLDFSRTWPRVMKTIKSRPEVS